MQPSKRHLPIVGLLGLVVVAAAGGGIYYYQFVQSHVIVTYPPSHRLIFMTAIVQEEGGYHVSNTAYLNQTNLPAFSSSGYNLTGVKYQNYQGSSDNKTIEAHVGDTLTFYIQGMNATSPDPQYHASTAHGFIIQGSGFTVNSGVLPGTIPFGKWYSVTVTFSAAGTYAYFCTIYCSPLHGMMNGNIVVT